MQIKKFQPVDHFVRATVYGGSGVGKTVFGGTAPKPIFASSENGLLSVVSTLGYAPDYVAINSVEDLQELYKFLKEGGHEYQTLVIDSMTEINEMIKERIEKKIGRPMQIKERGELAKQVKGIIRAMRELPIHVIMICQEKLNTDDDGHVINVKPMLNGKNADEIAYMMDIVAYMYINNRGERIITTAPSEKLVSKDRTGLLQTDVSLNFNDRVVAMQGMKTGSSEVVRDIPKSEEPPTPPKEAKIAATDKMTAMTAFAGYCTKANPNVDKKEFFTLFVADKFDGKAIDDLTESEGKQLIAIIQETSKSFDEQSASQAGDEVENESEANPIDEEVEESKKTANNTESKSIDTIIDDLPF